MIIIIYTCVSNIYTYKKTLNFKVIYFCNSSPRQYRSTHLLCNVIVYIKHIIKRRITVLFLFRDGIQFKWNTQLYIMYVLVILHISYNSKTKNGWLIINYYLILSMTIRNNLKNIVILTSINGNVIIVNNWKKLINQISVDYWNILTKML